MTSDDLRQALSERGLTRDRAAEVLGMSRRQVGYLLSGESRMTSARADSIRLRLTEYDNHERS